MNGWRIVGMKITLVHHITERLGPLETVTDQCSEAEHIRAEEFGFDQLRVLADRVLKGGVWWGLESPGQ